MKRPNYISHEQYVDSPMIYGQHAPYWSSLSLFEKIATIRQIGLASFIREIYGYADKERVYERMELEYGRMSSQYDRMEKRLRDLESENRWLHEERNKVAEELEGIRQHYRHAVDDVANPPSASDLFHRCNNEHWFKDYVEDVDSGIVRLIHDRKFYPCEEIVFPLGRLRVYDRSGHIANLTQCYAYLALSPKRYGIKLLPKNYRPYKIRILFGVEHDTSFWLQDPRSAKDVILEIWASYNDESFEHRSMPPDTDPEILQWKTENRGEICHISGYARQFNLIVSFERFINSGQTQYSKREIDSIREQCYSEYLDLYFKCGR